MEVSDEAHSSAVAKNKDANININVNGTTLQALISAAISEVVDKVLENKKEPSVTHSKIHTETHTSARKESFVHSSDGKSEPQELILYDKPRSTEGGCTYKYFVSCKPRDFNGEKGAIDAMEWLEEMETVVDISDCADKDVVKFVSQSFKGEALVWWKAMMQSTGKIPLYLMGWSKFADLIKENYCPQHEVEKVETDFLNLTMKNLNCQQYVTDFNSLSRLVPYLITPEPKRIARFIGGLAPEIKGDVKASRPTNYRSAVDLSLSLTLDVVRQKSFMNETNDKRQREEDNSQNPKKSKSKLNNNQQDSNKKPTCKTCKRRHWGQCQLNQKIKQCGICKRTGHQSHECRDMKDANCFSCGEKGHISTNCPKAAKKGAARSGKDKKGTAWTTG